MSRGGAAFTTEVERAANQPIHLFEGYFDSGTLYETDGGRAVSYGGNTYRAVGNFLQFEAVEESSDLQVHECRVSLSGVNDEWVALVQNSEYIDRRLVVRKAFLNDAQQLIEAATVMIFDGRMDAPAIQMDPDSGKYVVVISATSQLANLSRITGRRTNLADQQLHFPDDTGFRYAHEGTRQLLWGRPGAQPSIAQAQATAFLIRR